MIFRLLDREHCLVGPSSVRNLIGVFHVHDSSHFACLNDEVI